MPMTGRSNSTKFVEIDTMISGWATKKPDVRNACQDIIWEWAKCWGIVFSSNMSGTYAADTQQNLLFKSTKKEPTVPSNWSLIISRNIYAYRLLVTDFNVSLPNIVSGSLHIYIYYQGPCLLTWFTTGIKAWVSNYIHYFCELNYASINETNTTIRAWMDTYIP